MKTTSTPATISSPTFTSKTLASKEDDDDDDGTYSYTCYNHLNDLGEEEEEEIIERKSNEFDDSKIFSSDENEAKVKLMNIPTPNTHDLTSSKKSLASPLSNNNNHNNNNNNLFINFLPSNFNNDALKSLFLPFGEIETCRVMVDLISGQSRGFGFVKFKSQISAQSAIQSMNGAKIQNKTLLVRCANSDPSSPSTSQQEEGETSKSSSNVYIKGLPLEVTQENLVTIFSEFGEVLETKLLLDIATHTSRGQALVRLATVDQATAAINSLNGHVFPQSDNKPIVVRYAKNEDEKQQSQIKKFQRQQQQQIQQQYQQPQPQQTHNLRFSPYPSPTLPMIGNSPPTPPHHLYPYYQIQNLPAIHSPLLSTATPSTATGLIHGSINQDPTNLYINNLPLSVDDSYLYRLFGSSGAPISSVKIVRDPNTGISKGYGFVRMLNISDSYDAINSLNGIIIDGKQIQVSFKREKY